MILVDTNVLLDVLQRDPVWADWSEAALRSSASEDRLFINPLVYAELATAFSRIEELEAVVEEAELEYHELPREALFLIGAHAAVSGSALLTRDRRTYRTWFPTVRLITPTMG